MDASVPFDAVADAYDEEFTHTRLGTWLRAAVRDRVEPHLRAGMNVLELGCGTGEDAIWLARCGANVVATDQSTGMLRVAREKASRALEAARDESPGASASLPRFEVLDLGEPDALEGLLEGRGIDLVFSNFGALNCVADRGALGAALARVLRPRARLALTVMGPTCAWEIAWFLAHGRPREAFRRRRPRTDASVGHGQTITVDYPSAVRLRAELGPGFETIASWGIGSFLPPSYLERLTRRSPRIFERLHAWDIALAGRAPFVALADHYLEILRWRGVAGGRADRAAVGA